MVGELLGDGSCRGAAVGEVAERRVSVTPSLDSHVRKKEAVYRAGLSRLREKLNARLRGLQEGEATPERIRCGQARLVRMHIDNPNLARLLQHEALSGGPGSELIIEQLFKPLIESSSSAMDSGVAQSPSASRLRPWIVMGFNNIVMSYVTMAPLYRGLLDIDPLGAEAAERQVEFITRLTDAFWTSGLGKEIWRP